MNTLIIQIDPHQSGILNRMGYTLSVARVIATAQGEEPPVQHANVIWSATQVSGHNELSWTSDYKVFCAKTYEENAPVESMNEKKSIGFGQTCTIDKSGKFGNAVGDLKQSDTFLVLNDRDQPTGSFSDDRGVNVGVTCSMKPPGSEDYQDIPFYVSQDKVPPKGAISLTPLDKVLVWIQRDGQAQHMVADRMNDHELPILTVDFAAEGSKVLTASYGADGTWRLGPLPPFSSEDSGTWARGWGELHDRNPDGTQRSGWGSNDIEYK
ncbi:hypothetical protein CPB86DRAFT_818196 [Serendipita vermifera]|nr:hypothetical protein CPB86DRAFT_818196 [Serendipita vermifera]